MDDYTHYDFLDLPPGASTARIEAAYQTIKQRLNGHSDEQMIRMIHEAYTVLSDTEQAAALRRRAATHRGRGRCRAQERARQPGYAAATTRSGCSVASVYRDERVGRMRSLRYGFDVAPRSRFRAEPPRRAPSRARLRPGAAMLARNRRKLHPGRLALDRHRPLIVSGSRASPPPIYM